MFFIAIIFFKLTPFKEFFIFKIIAQAGLIKTLEKIEKSEEGNFKLGFKEGKKYFWKIFLIGLILGMMVFILLVILALPVGLLFYFKALLPGILATILAIAIFIPLARNVLPFNNSKSPSFISFILTLVISIFNTSH